MRKISGKIILANVIVLGLIIIAGLRLASPLAPNKAPTGISGVEHETLAAGSSPVIQELPGTTTDDAPGASQSRGTQETENGRAAGADANPKPAGKTAGTAVAEQNQQERLAVTDAPARKTAVITKEQAEEANAKYKENNNFGRPGTQRNLYYKIGDLPVILSAPHAVTQWRDNKVKVADAYTGAIVELVSQRVNCSYIAKAFNDNTDANDDEKSDYRDFLADIIINNGIKCLLDIHGVNSEMDTDIDIGTNYDLNINKDKRIKALVLDLAKQYGLKCTWNKYYPASNQNRVSTDIHRRTGIPSLQIEINGQYRFRGAEPEEVKLEKFNVIVSFIEELCVKLSAQVSQQ